MEKRFLSIAVASLFAISGFAQHSSIGGYNVYYGSLHNHSVICGHAPNAGRPVDVYNYAKNTAKLDFFSMAEHDAYSVGTSYYPITQAYWDEIKAAANSTNQDGVFTALWGFEWSSMNGHVGIIGTDDYTTSWTWYNQIPLPGKSYTCPTFSELVTWLSSRNGAAFFHHPGRARTNDGSTNEFELFKSNTSYKFAGMELWNKNDDWYRLEGVNTSDTYGPYEEALSRGWRIGAGGGFDDHNGKPGSSSYLYNFAVLANALNRTEIMSALKARRFFSTFGKKVALSFKINGNEMGSVIPAGSGTVRILAQNMDGRKFTKVELLTKGEELVNSWVNNASSVDITYTLNTAEKSYYYVRLTQDNNTAQWTVSSPIFTETTPVLITTYSVIGSSSDDAEEANTKVNLTSSDLELPIEYNLQTIGLRYTGLNIPKGATINSATIQFTTKQTSSTTTTINIYGHNHDNSPAFNTTSNNVTSRTLTSAYVSWQPAAWTTLYQASTAQKTPDIKSIVQQIVNRSSYTTSSAITFIIKGSGKRVAYTYDGSSSYAPLLTISYTPAGSSAATIKNVRISSSINDVEEHQSGWMYTNSSDLEMFRDDHNQTVGMRFTGLEIPREASIHSAYIQFTVDETCSDPTTITIRGEASDNPLTFSTANANISGRPRTTAYANWQPGAWGVIGQTQQTPNLTSIIKEIVNRPGYSSSSAICLIANGTAGRRVARSYDYSPAKAAKLVVTYAGSYNSDSYMLQKSAASTEYQADSSVVLNVYPTIFANWLNITTGTDSPVQYRLINIHTGEIVASGLTSGAETIINTSFVKKGHYVVNVTLNNTLHKFKVNKL